MTENKLYNFNNAVKRLNEARIEYNKNKTNSFVRDSIIQRFEFSTELAWKTLREFMLDQSYLDSSINTPKKVFAKAYQENLINDEEIWLDMLTERNNTSHIYNEDTAKIIADKIALRYAKALTTLAKTLKELE